MTTFRGFPAELFDFYEGLERDNSKAYWERNRATWENAVRAPMLALLDELAAEFGPLRMFRPTRDVRFSKDKSPYKLWVGATSERRAVGGIGYYIELSASHLVTGFGAMLMTSDQLQRFRVAIDDDRCGGRFEEIRDTLAEESLLVTPGIEPPLKRTPSRYAADHPREEFLRWKGAAVVQEFDRARWMQAREALDRIRTFWRASQPLRDWLDVNVGPTTSPDRRAG